MKTIITLTVFAGLLLLNSCRSSPAYICHCNNNAHPDSSTSFHVGTPSSTSKDTAAAICNTYGSQFPSDTCFVLLENVGTPM